MWVMTTRGFFSAVQKTGDTDLTIRARCRKDIENLAELLDGREVIDGEGTDYAYRLRCSHEEWATALARLALDVDYRNFKDEVKAVQGKQHADAYGRVWGALLGLEDAEAKRRFGVLGNYGLGASEWSSLTFDDEVRLLSDPPFDTKPKPPKRRRGRRGR